MFTLHKIEKKYTVTIPKEEFLILIANYRKFEPIEIVEDEDLDYLTEEEIKIRKEAMKELQGGKTINFKNVKHKWLKGESANV